MLIRSLSVNLTLTQRSSFLTENVPSPRKRHLVEGGSITSWFVTNALLKSWRWANEPAGLVCHKCTAQRLEMSQDFTMTWEDLIQIAYYPADSCVISPSAFLFKIMFIRITQIDNLHKIYLNQHIQGYFQGF